MKIINQIYHGGLTVINMDYSVAFYQDILGLPFKGELIMEGPEMDCMFRKKNSKA